MPLNKEALKEGIIALQQEMKTKTEPDEEYYAEKLATLIDTFVKSGTVTIPQGIPVTTVGTAVAQAGSTTTPAIGTIS
ncbi:hypothetical protein [Capnocytophaga cynodegmi]|uniref:hypothetical protein n=1 Tax=Capnocytophaga cynodegmi TaxID=28189 RepID=UPI001ACB7EF6|nr:hypothetical protein [Capnocytophaga cynodegmi]GIM53760.1 hypothetical protein CAPN005_04070 [Capnocytophaga cynodegmi]